MGRRRRLPMSELNPTVFIAAEEKLQCYGWAGPSVGRSAGRSVGRSALRYVVCCDVAMQIRKETGRMARRLADRWVRGVQWWMRR